MKRFRCPGCKDLQEYDESLAGQVFACTNCGKKVRLPANAAPAKSATIKKDRDEEEDEEERKPARPAAKRKPVEEEEEEEERISTRPAAKRKAVEEDDGPYPDDEDEPEDRPRRKRIKKKRRGPSRATSNLVKLPGGFKLSPFALTLVGFGAAGVVLILIGFVFSFVFPPVAAVLSILLYGMAMLLMMGGGLWMLVIAFQDDVLQGLLCLFIPFYSLFYLITHFEDCKRPFFVQLVGFALMFGAACPLACAGAGGGAPMPPQQFPSSPPPPNFPVPPRR
jgi:hypothetical protein